MKCLTLFFYVYDVMSSGCQAFLAVMQYCLDLKILIIFKVLNLCENKVKVEPLSCPRTPRATYIVVYHHMFYKYDTVLYSTLKKALHKVSSKHPILSIIHHCCIQTQPWSHIHYCRWWLTFYGMTSSLWCTSSHN